MNKQHLEFSAVNRERSGRTFEGQPLLARQGAHAWRSRQSRTEDAKKLLIDLTFTWMHAAP